MTYEYVIGLGRPADCNGDGLVDAKDLTCVCGESHAQLEDVLAAAGLPHGDIDGDGVVAFSDFLIMSDSFGEPGDYSFGDLDCSGTVDFQDFLILSANFGEAQKTVAAVPEPTTWLMLLAGMCAIASKELIASNVQLTAGRSQWRIRLDDLNEFLKRRSNQPVESKSRKLQRRVRNFRGARKTVSQDGS